MALLRKNGTSVLAQNCVSVLEQNCASVLEQNSADILLPCYNVTSPECNALPKKFRKLTIEHNCTTKNDGRREDNDDSSDNSNSSITDSIDRCKNEFHCLSSDANRHYGSCTRSDVDLVSGAYGSLSEKLINELVPAYINGVKSDDSPSSTEDVMQMQGSWNLALLHNKVDCGTIARLAVERSQQIGTLVAETFGDDYESDCNDEGDQ